MNDFDFSLGEPTFVFNITGTTVDGESLEYNVPVTVTKEDVESHESDDGYYTVTKTLDLKAGAWNVTEVILGNYVLSEVTDVSSNGNVTYASGSVVPITEEEIIEYLSENVNAYGDWEVSESDGEEGVSGSSRTFTLTLSVYSGLTIYYFYITGEWNDSGDFVVSSAYFDYYSADEYMETCGIDLDVIPAAESGVCAGASFTLTDEGDVGTVTFCNVLSDNSVYSCFVENHVTVSQ